MRRVRGGLAAVAVVLLFAPSAIATTGTIVFEPPSRVDRPGRGRVQARQSAPQVAEAASGPLVVWEDDRDVRLRYIGASRDRDRWTEIDPRLPRLATTLASDGAGRAWALADSPDGITTRSTSDGRTWTSGPRLLGPHTARHAIAAAGDNGRLVVARATLDEAACGRVGATSNMPSAAKRGDGRGVSVATLDNGEADDASATLLPSGLYVDVDAAISPSGVAWVAAATLHGVRLYRERSPGVWEPEVVPPVIPAASIQRVRVAPTETEVVVIVQLRRGRENEIVSRAFRPASESWGAPRVLGPHDGTPTLDATVVRPDASGDESSVVAVWIAGNEVRVDERNRRIWGSSPTGTGGLPDSVALATVDGHAVLAFAARRADASTTRPEGAPNTDVFVRTRNAEHHWGEADRVDREVRLAKRPGEPRVWTSDRDAFVGFNDDVYGAGAPVVARREGSGWSDARPLVVDRKSGEIVLVAPDGSRVVRVDETFVFQDASGRTLARVDDVGRENDVVSTGAGMFAAASIVGDPGRGDDQRFEVHEVGRSRERVTRLTIGPATNLDLFADERGGTELVTTTYNRGRETLRIVARHLRAGRLGAQRTIATAVPPDHVVVADREGRLLVAWRDDDGITVEVSAGVRRTISVARPGFQFFVGAGGENVAVVFASGGRLVVARSDGGRFTQLPLLPGRFAKIESLGYGYSTPSIGLSPYGACFASPRTNAGGGSMSGWETDLRVTDDGGITLAARHNADVLVARVEADDETWSYGEAGTGSKDATADVAIDAAGDPVVAWVDTSDGRDRLVASSVARGGRGRVLPAVAAGVAALALLGVAVLTRRRRSA